MICLYTIEYTQESNRSSIQGFYRTEYVQRKYVSFLQKLIYLNQIRLYIRWNIHYSDRIFKEIRVRLQNLGEHPPLAVEPGKA